VSRSGRVVLARHDDGLLAVSHAVLPV